jgi:hypothetical protein
MTYILAFVAVSLAVVFLFIGAWWGSVIAVIGGAIVLAYIAIARRENPEVGTIESGRREPTGTPRKATADAETANERVGQS